MPGGVLTPWASADPQPNPAEQYDAWARFVTADRYAITHVFGSGMGVMAAILGTFGLGAHLAGMNLDALPESTASALPVFVMLAAIVLGLVGNLLLGVAIWRSVQIGAGLIAVSGAWMFWHVLHHPGGFPVQQALPVDSRRAW